MTSRLRWAAALCVTVVLLGAGFVAYRLKHPSGAILASAAETLSPTAAEDGGSEPASLPTGPVLKNASKDPSRLAIDFGYKVGATPYAYHLAVGFSGDGDQGAMDLGIPRGSSDDLDQFPVSRHWSESRRAYLVAVTQDLTAIRPAVPSLCVRAVIGPSKTSLDLRQASLCVMQRDQDGRCHPATLACGLLR